MKCSSASQPILGILGNIQADSLKNDPTVNRMIPLLKMMKVIDNEGDEVIENENDEGCR